MSAAGITMGNALLSYKQTASAAFFTALGKKKPTAADYAQLNTMLAQAEGNAIVDNVGSAANWDGGQANTNYGGMTPVNGGTV